MFSEQQQLILISIVVVYFLFLFGLSLYVNRKIKTYDDYNVASRSVSLLPLILTFTGTAIGGSILLGYMTNGYLFGMGQQWLAIGFTLTSIVLAIFLLKRIRILGEKYNMVTLGDFTALRYGEGARVPTVICILVAYCAITGMQFVAIATILNLTLGMSMTVGILISWVLLTLKTYFGGLKSVIWQDVIHGTIQTIGVFILFAVILYTVGDWGAVADTARNTENGNMLSIFNISTSDFLIYMLTIGAYQFVRQDLWQRFWAAKDIKTAKSGYWAAIILGFLTAAIVVAIGVFTKFGLNMTNIDPALIYYEVIGAVLPFTMVIVMLIALLATVISCADSFFIAASSSIVNDIVKPRMGGIDNKRMLHFSRLSVAVVSVIALLLALYIPQLVTLWITGSAMLVSGLLAPVLFGLFWKRTTKSAGIIAMWSGLVVAVIWQIAGHPFGLHPVFIGLPVSIVTILSITLLSPQESEHTLYEDLKEIV
ncbi:sodium:solute symporter family protein [Pseudalkalibacillus salsuginis]|uniref:sodium:solute symporter family protein n=1 Tax=Pseudalkalibacillus salsuginis TaxID=2910972 RepID=UPI001F3B2464|nr:sodium:solute symporter family protein [Pseudalkalibacillus salsuginis]MCF6408577.1 sodium:solute symporter family protein [Pseudalkalibacillus salsuginis]